MKYDGKREMAGQLDLTNPNIANGHITFGVGVHFCLGAYLACTEAQIIFKTVLDRLPNIRLVDNEPAWDLTKPNSRMLKTLPVLF